MSRALFALVGLSALSCASVAGLDDYGQPSAGGAGGSATGSATTGGGGMNSVGGGGSTGVGGGGGARMGRYSEAVWGSKPTYYWRLGDDSAANGVPAVAATGPDGTYGGDVSSVPGLIVDADGAISFETDGRMTVPGQDFRAFSAASSGFTVELWFEASQGTTTGTLIGLLGSSSWTFRLRLDAGGLYFDMASMNGSGSESFGVPVGDGIHHVVATWQGDMFVACLALDGKMPSCSDPGWGSLDMPAANASLVVGGEETEPNGAIAAHFGGVIDEVAIYIPELAGSEATEHFVIGAP